MTWMIAVRTISCWGLSGLVIATLAACGGAKAAVGDATATETPQGVAMDDSKRAQEIEAKDPKVKEARERCDAEIRKSTETPQAKLTPIQVKACMYAAKPQIAVCSQGPSIEVVLKVILSNKGKVINAFPIGDTADTPAALCVADTIKQATFPAFTGAQQQTLKYPFRLGD